MAIPAGVGWTSPWLRNLDVETERPIQGKLTGQVPCWLRGCLVRNGAGIFKYGNTEYNHLFDGSAVLHRFSIQEGSVTYQNRILRSDAYVKNHSANRITVSEFGTVAFKDPCQSLWGRFKNRFSIPDFKNSTDNCAVNVAYIGEALYAITETNFLRRVDHKTLETIGPKLSLSDYVAVNHATAHPHIEEDGTVYNIGNSYGKKGPCYNIIKFPAGKRQAINEVEGTDLEPFLNASIIATINATRKLKPSYYHSFGMTENFFIFVELPLVINLLKILSSPMVRRPFSWALEWLANEKARFFVVNRGDGKQVPVVYEAPAFVCFHHINAYEEGNKIVVDMCTIDDGSVITKINVNTLYSNSIIGGFPNFFVRRYMLPLEPPQSTVTCRPTSIYHQPLDLPRINYRYNGKKYRYTYAAGMNLGSITPVKLVKLDMMTGESKIWEREGFSVSEPVFVERNQEAEDSGVVLASILPDDDLNKVGLLILDAQSWEQIGLVEFETPGVVPKDFHGLFSAANATVHRY